MSVKLRGLLRTRLVAGGVTDVVSPKKQRWQTRCNSTQSRAHAEPYSPNWSNQLNEALKSPAATSSTVLLAKSDPKFPSRSSPAAQFSIANRKNYRAASDVASIYANNDTLSLQIDGVISDFDSVFVRDSCRCSHCVNSSGQKTFQTSDIPTNIEIADARIEADHVHVLWRNDLEGFLSDHTTVLSPVFFRSRAQENGPSPCKPDPEIWLSSKSMYDAITKVDFEEFIANDAALKKGVIGLAKQGITFIQNVPEREEAVAEVAERIGPIRHTFYGRIWDVKDKPDADNVAYTSSYLGLHMDLLYMNEPPGLQLLHCMRSSCKGGESMFADTYAAALMLYNQAPDAFNILCEFPVSYSYRRDRYDYRFTRPTIVPESYGHKPSVGMKIDHINWSPPFQFPLEVDVGVQDSGNRLRRYHRAARAFASLIENPKHQLKHYLKPGECVIFNNRRIVHGRQAFESNTGERWLRGAYVDTDDFYSKWRWCRFDDRPRSSTTSGRVSEDQ